MNQIAETSGTGTDKRHQLAWLLGALLLAAGLNWWVYVDDREDYRRMNPSVPRAAPAGDWVRYDTARWRLVEARVVAPTDLQGLRLRSDSQVVLATLDVMVDDGIDGNSLDSCKSVLRDPASEREWAADPLPLSRYATKPYGDSCGSRLGQNFKREVARAGRPFRFQQVYQLPRGIPLAGLKLELHLPLPKREQRGTYLDFTL